MPDVAVVVSVRNAAQTITQCLTAVRQSNGISFELIVVDAGSTDGTPARARELADQVVVANEHAGRNKARSIGVAHTRAPLVVNIDADVLVLPDTLRILKEYFDRHPDVDAVTGMLSREHPNRDFLSQYKNLYMHRMFLSLPRRIQFLYGSLYAFRRELAALYPLEHDLGEDTAFGQRLVQAGKRIDFIREAEVIHLKKYSVAGFVKNEFVIPYYWAQLFLVNRGWAQMARGYGRFSHASGSQIAGVLLVFALAITGGFVFMYPGLLMFWLFLLCLWLLTQLRFFVFYKRERGVGFALAALVTALGDDMVKAAGIIAGCIYFVIHRVEQQ